MFVVKATLKDETRRLTFDRSKFPPYSEIQQKLRSTFNLPSTTHTYWVNVLLFPDDAQEARIMFKKHVCDASEYESAQTPFARSGLPSPALVFTVLLSSDPRLNSIHGYHRANNLLTSAGDLAIHISSIEEDLAKRVSLLTALEAKLSSCQKDNDRTGIQFWSERVNDKKKSVKDLETELLNCQEEFNKMNDQLDGTTLPDGYPPQSLRNYAEVEEREEVVRAQQTEDELAAWKAGNEYENESQLFPPLDHLIPPHVPRYHGHGRREFRHRPQPLYQTRGGWAPIPPPPPPPFNQQPFGGFGSQGPRFDQPQGDRGIRNLFDRVSDVLNPPVPADLVPAKEIKTMLDTFLVNLSNQLATTFEGAPRVATTEATSETERPIPGAFVQNNNGAQAQADAKVQTQPVKEEKKVNSRSAQLGKGGFRHRRIWCDGCEEGIRGVRYKCEQCPDYDLCGSCLPLLHSSDLHPSAHTFKAMLHRDLEERIKLNSEGQAEESVRHPATCDLCSLSITGIRWKCLNCPDWDSCNSCATTITESHPGHSFVKLHKSSDYVPNAAIEEKENQTHPHIVCDGCNGYVRGSRYKCMHPACPDYDLCETCEASPHQVHPVDHPMLKMKLPLKLNFSSHFEGPRASENPSPDHPHRHARRGHAHERRVNGDAFGPRRAGCWRQHESPDGSRFGRREHVNSAISTPPAQPFTSPKMEEKEEPVIPGGFVARNLYDAQDSIGNLSAPLTPDNKIAESEFVGTELIPTAAEVVPALVGMAKAVTSIIQESATVPTTSRSGIATPKEPVTPLDIFSWVRHLTIPPGCTLPPGAEFTKTWKVKNFASGSEYNFEKVKLALKSDGSLGEASNTIIEYNKDDIKDGDELVITLSGLKISEDAERGSEIVEFWRFEDENGVEYGQPLRLRFTVEELPKSACDSLNSSAVIMPSSSTSTLTAPVVESVKTSRATTPSGDVTQYDLSSSTSSSGAAFTAEEGENINENENDTESQTEENESVISLDSEVSDDGSIIDIDGVKTETTASTTSSSVTVHSEDEDDEFEIVENGDSDDETADEL